jgi:beta-N-acetylhexosaminidase
MTEKTAGFISNASASSAAGQLLIVGFDGTRYTSPIGSWFKKIRPAGVVLFARNIENAGQTRLLISDMTKLAEDQSLAPLFVCVDQEGGRVSRLPKEYPPFPSARELGKDGSEELVETSHAKMGQALADIGFNVDFAPVLDLDTNPVNPIIGDRSFSADQEKAGRLGRAAIRGLRSAGLLSCAKHFPGHGDTSLDSHHDLPVDSRPVERIEEVELHPFREAFAESVEFVMTAHVIYPAYDVKLPATLSEKIVTGLLRENMKYNGVIVGDDMDMKAVTGHWGTEESTRLAMKAGVDMLLVCHETARREDVHEALRRMIVEGAIAPEEVSARIGRIFAAKTKIRARQEDEENA